MSTAESSASFDQLQLNPLLLQAITELGYETPSPIQEQSIPLLLDGHDLLGQAQTGTGKTAAFALPALTRIELAQRTPQVLVLTPTRELALQVSEAFHAYGRHMKGLQVLAVYGGQGMDTQLRALKRGVHIVVGTPGRVMDHMRRKTLNLEALQLLVLDEADEMLRMGFHEDVEWILEQIPQQRQLALFSATMPAPILRIARQHMAQAQEIKIATKTVTVSAIHQRYWLIPESSKLEATTRLLETEDCDGMLVFVRTRSTTVELAEQLAARGYAAAALNGDMPQALRERMVTKLKEGSLDILVATDVAARGLDVERISHVLNYDIPYDAEAYVHRIGRTGRAGRSGNAMLFVNPREKHLLRTLERTIKQPIEACELPKAAAVTKRRIERFKQQLLSTINDNDLALYRQVISELCEEHDVNIEEAAAALTFIAQREQPFQVKEIELPKEKARNKKRSLQVEFDSRKKRRDSGKNSRSRRESADMPMTRYRVEVGRNHQVGPGDIVGAIANEAGIDGQLIGRIKLFEDYSTVDLPTGMPKAIFKQLRKTWIRNQQLRISVLEGTEEAVPEKSKARKKNKNNHSDRHNRFEAAA